MLPGCGWFEAPQGKEERVCVHSGHIAGKYCRDTRIERTARNAVKSKKCPYCAELPVSVDDSHRVVDASEPMVMKSYFQLPPVHKYYYVQCHADYVEPPAALQADESSMKFVYPADGAVISLPRRADGCRSELTCKAVHANPNAELFWHLDNNYVGSTKDIHQVQISPSEGFHKLTVYDNVGSGKSVEFIIK